MIGLKTGGRSRILGRARHCGVGPGLSRRAAEKFGFIAALRMRAQSECGGSEGQSRKVKRLVPVT